MLKLKPIGSFVKDNSPSAVWRKVKGRWYLDSIFEKAIFLAGIFISLYSLYKFGEWFVLR